MLEDGSGVLDEMGLAELLSQEPELAAPYLLGSYLVSTIGGGVVRARVTEVEAYKGSDDPASHAYGGRTQRNDSMYQRAGTLYVYLSYGIHLCANVAAGPDGVGWGILFRGAEIVEGAGIARSRRGRQANLSDGPGKLTQALGVEAEDDGLYLLDDSSPIHLEPGITPEVVVATPRVGISKAKDRPWRFVEVSAATPVG